MADVIATGLRFPEGPAFHPIDGSLWGVEIEGGSLFRLSEKGLERHAVGGRPNGLAFAADGQAYICDQGLNAVRRVPAWGRQPETFVSDVAGAAPHRPNDLAFDPAGHLVFTCPGESRSDPHGQVWCRSLTGDCAPIAMGLYFPNGLAFTPDGGSLVIAETYRQRLWRGGWNAKACRWIAPQPWCDLRGPTGPDGLAFDTAGNLFVALFGQGCVVVVNPDGHIVDEIPTPGARPTNLAFDPSGRLGLVVTEAERGEVLSYSDRGPGASLFRGCRADLTHSREEVALS